MILLLSTSDTDLITADASDAEYRVANPSRILLDDVPGMVADADLTVVRILGGRRAWEEGLDAVLAVRLFRAGLQARRRATTPAGPGRAGARA